MKEETYLKQMDSFSFLKKKKPFLNKHVSICLPNFTQLKKIKMYLCKLHFHHIVLHAGLAMRKKSFSFVYLEK